ncbi:MAG: sigma-70 family RNA polymerase sigma factor [Lachnospiraceae bacterium]|nr:sigma-70 family RNA polymerase sigma factor [Lachnospiraceae bacterium]
MMNNLPNAEEVYLRYITECDDRNLETLLKAFREGLYLFLLSYVKNEEDAEELLMDTFARLAVDKPSFKIRQNGSFKSWLYAIARNNALMHIRRRKMEAVPLEEELVADAETPESELLKEERNKTLYKALSTLKSEYRRALMLLYIEGLSHEEIAQAMGLKIRQIYNLVERGKKSLRNTLEGMGIKDAQY